MAIEERDLLQKLYEQYKDRVIYTDLYFQQHQGDNVDTLLRRLAKDAGKTRGQWLTEHGFQWKETGYVEPDMQRRKAKPPVQDAFSIADYVFRAYPLAGEFIPPKEERNLLYQSAEETVRHILSGRPLKGREAVVLVLETIQLLKDWDHVSVSGVDTFWRYIFRQYGFNAENREKEYKQLYQGFQDAISFVMGKNKYGEYRYRRFMAPETTQRFYTTLLLHAMAPRQSMEALFNILFDFYAKYLDFQYVEEDISFKVLTKEMRARWDSSVFRSETLHLRGDAVYSGLQCLFQQRPEYMAVQCDSLVRKIDLILRGEERGTLDPKRNYWDRLLLDWYEKKSGTERARMQDTRRSRKTEYVATSKDRIQVSYVLQNETVGLSFPRIRLPSVEEQIPVFRVYQGDSLLYEDTLSVTGNRNDLCLTTQSRFLPLSAAGYDGAAPMNLHMEIEYGNETLYRSGEKLNRPWLLFDGEGRERSQKTGIVWLFADNTRNVEFSGEDGVYLCLHPGQLYRVNLGEVTSITVDGGEVFADERTASRFRHYTSVSRIRMLGAGSPPCDVFPAPFTLTVCLPEGENPIRYRIFADGTPLSPSQADVGFVLTPPDSPAVTHRIYVTDLVSGNTRYAYSYILKVG